MKLFRDVVKSGMKSDIRIQWFSWNQYFIVYSKFDCFQARLDYKFLFIKYLVHKKQICFVELFVTII